MWRTRVKFSYRLIFALLRTWTRVNHQTKDMLSDRLSGSAANCPKNLAQSDVVCECVAVYFPYTVAREFFHEPHFPGMLVRSQLI
jgi:hypothetical protein